MSHALTLLVAPVIMEANEGSGVSGLLEEKDLLAIAQLMDFKLAQQKQEMILEMAQQKKEIISETMVLIILARSSMPSLNGLAALKKN